MELVRHVKARRWPTLFGYILFIGMMATGYYYNLTFVQLGLVDLGRRAIGLSEARVAGHLALLALVTCVIALAFGWLMWRHGWSEQFIRKLRLAFAVVLLQTVLTAVVPVVRDEVSFVAWIVAASAALGLGVPVMFSLTVDLIPARDRGYVAALVTSAAYFAAEVFSVEWTIDEFRARILWLVLAGTIGLGVFAFGKFPLLNELAAQHTQPGFAFGRFVRRDRTGREWINRRLFVLVALMFGIYFVDSLGFLRLIDTPVYVDTAWQSPQLATRLFIGGTHVVAAWIAGVLYAALDERSLFFWVFGIFGLAHLMYTFHTRLAAGDDAPLAMPMLYAIAVSLYTVVNFALWADVSTPRTVSLNTAVGVALSGWTATFLSTALAIQWRIDGMPIDRHLQIVDALAILFFLFVLASFFIPIGGRELLAHEGDR